nr:MAG TPA: hypothetical protein [Caudoviricetes sp.]
MVLTFCFLLFCVLRVYQSGAISFSYSCCILPEGKIFAKMVR